MRGKYEEEEAVFAGESNQTVCVLDASTFVGYWILKKLLVTGYKVHAAVQKNGNIYNVCHLYIYLCLFEVVGAM